MSEDGNFTLNWDNETASLFFEDIMDTEPIQKERSVNQDTGKLVLLYVYPAIFFFLLFMRSFIQSMRQNGSKKDDQDTEALKKAIPLGFVSCSRGCGRLFPTFRSPALPWDGMVLMASTGTGILLTVVLFQAGRQVTSTSDGLEDPDLLHTTAISLVTMYLAFSLAGLVDMAAYFKLGTGSNKDRNNDRSTLGEKLFQMALALAYTIETLLLAVLAANVETQLGEPLTLLLIPSITSILVHLLIANKGQGYHHVSSGANLLQSTWLFHQVGQAVSRPAWSRLYFAWHLLTIGTFLYGLYFLLAGKRTASNEPGLDETKVYTLTLDRVSEDSQRTNPPSTCVSNFGSDRTSSEGKVKGYDRMDESFLQKQMPVYSNTLAPPGLCVLPNSKSRTDAEQADVPTGKAYGSTLALAEPAVAIAECEVVKPRTTGGHPGDLAKHRVNGSSSQHQLTSPTPSRASSAALLIESRPATSSYQGSERHGSLQTTSARPGSSGFTTPDSSLSGLPSVSNQLYQLMLAERQQGWQPVARPPPQDFADSESEMGQFEEAKALGVQDNSNFRGRHRSTSMSGRRSRSRAKEVGDTATDDDEVELTMEEMVTDESDVFSTLSRQVTAARASIKVKESRII